MWSSAAAGEPTATAVPSSSSSSVTASSAASTGSIPANGRRTQQTGGVWAFDASPFDATASSSAGSSSASSATTNGVIGAGYVHSHVSKSRLLWNRTAPEEEEREEEALPSYLTYLQPSFRSSSTSSLNASDRIPSGSSLGLSGWGDDSLGPRNASSSMATPSSLSASSNQFIPSSPAAYGALSATAGPFVSAASSAGMYGHGHSHSHPSIHTGSSMTTGVESKSKELAMALQDFVRQQVEQQQQRNPSVASGSHGQAPCNCEPLKLRVADLEHKLLTLSQQVTSLAGTSHSPPVVLAGPPGLAPPPPPASQAMSVGMSINTSSAMLQPPLPPTPPHSGGLNNGALVGLGGLGSPSSAAAAVSGINDRVSTLEGRQSAFQSQLAQISKVLGVPIGKHGKNSQIKNLVQTLREEIDVKLSTSAKEIEAKCVSTVAETVEQVVARAVEERLQDAPGAAGAAAGPASQLSYDAVFGALAEEHEASLGKLSAYFEERLGQESKQRVGLEGRIQSRFGEHEEWLQQLEGEFGSWHDRSSTVASQLRVLQNKIHEMDEKWKAEQLKWSKVAADLQLGVVGPSAATTAAVVSPTAAAPALNTTSVETLTRSVHQLQTQYKQFHSEYKTETSELRENLVLMETWVKTTRQETRDLSKSTKGMKQLVEKLVRDTGSAEELLQQYVSTITHQVASVTRQYVSVRIRDNNRLIDATLRARVPAYIENETESFMLVRPEKKTGEDNTNSSSLSASGFVLKDDDEEGIRKLLKEQVEKAATSSDSSGASSPAQGDEK